jgi:hypothetical protein
MNTGTESSLAAFVKQRVAELGDQKLPRQVALDAGFDSEKTLQAIETGRLKLPIDRAIALADALEVDRRELLLLTLGQYLDTEVVDLVSQNAELSDVHLEFQSSVVAMQAELTAIGGRALSLNGALNEIVADLQKVIDDAAEIGARQASTREALDRLLKDVRR